MRKRFKTKISAFKSLFDSSTPFELTLEEIIERIKLGNDSLIDKIEKIRDKKTPKEVKDSIKKSLLSVTFCGTFSKRAKDSLLEHSGMICLDFDKYPNEETLQEERKRIESDPFTLACFRSPSGNGLKVLVRIPKSTPQEHERRFRAYQKYINSDYFDIACKDVSRVCFESYDPDLYFKRYDPIEFTEIAPEAGVKIVELTPFDIPLTDEYEICDKVVNEFKWSSDFGEGERNNHVYKTAAMLCNYGVSEDFAFKFIMNNVVYGDFTERECEHAVNSAYKRVPFGAETYIDHKKGSQIKKAIKKGVTPQEIAKENNISEKKVKEIKDVVQNNYDTFWDIIKVVDGDKETEVVIFEPFKIKGFYKENGFYKYTPNAQSNSIPIRVTNNKVETVSQSYIHTFMTDFVDPSKSKKGSQVIFNEFFKKQKRITSDESLSTLLDNIQDFDKKILKDTKNECFLLFKNNIVKVTKEKVEEINYIDIDKYVWKERIINRNYKKSESTDNDFKDFISKISNKEEKRIDSLESTIGYLISNHKDKKYQKAVILNDEEINDNPNGGSGKSLFFNALTNFKKNGLPNNRVNVQLDGKSFNTNKSFIYSGISHETELMCFDDVKKNFNFEALFSLITEGIEIEKKSENKFFIPFEDSPKVVITTNYVIKGAGGSHHRRRHEVEFYQHFNSNHSPLDEYGKQLFDEWTIEEWISFDGYMIANVQKFLKNGLTQVKSINADVKRFIQQTHEDFYEWIKDDDNVLLNAKCYNNDKVRDFINEFKGWEKTMTNKTFMKFVSEWANFKGLDLEKKRDNKGRYFMLSLPIKTTTTTIPNNDIDTWNGKGQDVEF